MSICIYYMHDKINAFWLVKKSTIILLIYGGTINDFPKTNKMVKRFLNTN